MNKNKYITTKQLADLLGISRIAVFKKIQSGIIKAHKNGRNYQIDPSDIPGLEDKLSINIKKILGNAVDKTVREYGETLRMLAKE